MESTEFDVRAAAITSAIWRLIFQNNRRETRPRPHLGPGKRSEALAAENEAVVGPRESGEIVVAVFAIEIFVSQADIELQVNVGVFLFQDRRIVG